MAAYSFPCADAEMDAEPVGVCAGSAHAVYIWLRPLYDVLPGVDAVLILLVAEFGCFLLITAGTVIVEAVEWFSGWVAEL